MAKERTRRTSINGTRNILKVEGKEPGYEYRIVNDDGDRVSQFQERGYEIVTDKSVKVGDRRIANPTAEGSPVQVSVGGGQKAYIMRIKDEWYKEDQAAKQKEVDETVASMKKDAADNADFGKLQIS